MNQEQAARLIGVDQVIAYAARFDAQSRLVGGWHRARETDWWEVPGQLEALREGAAGRAATGALWGTSPGDQLARQITVDALTGIITLLVPVPGGGFVVAALERRVIRHAAEALADRLEAAARREFGPTWAPVAVAVLGVAAFVVLASLSDRG